MEPTPENVGSVMLKLRQEEGPAAVANRCIPHIETMKKRVVLIDGIRSLHETDAFKQRFAAFVLLAIHSCPETRFKRLFKRNRSDDPVNWQVFLERDWRELRVGLGDVIALADVMIVNEGTQMQLKREAEACLRRVASR
jgi:dephospho-CoA kinase